MLPKTGIIVKIVELFNLVSSRMPSVNDPGAHEFRSGLFPLKVVPSKVRSVKKDVK